MEDAGYRVLEAAGGEAALSLAAQDSPALALMDVVMPRLGGIEALDRLRHLHPETLVLIRSAATIKAARRQRQVADQA